MIYSSDLTGKRKGMDDIPNASLTQKGITKVINSMESDDETSAVSINTVRELCELANTVKEKIPKSKVTINGINGTSFTISKTGTNISGNIGSNGKTIVEISELGNYNVVGTYNGKSITTTVNIDSVGLYEIDLYVSVSFDEDSYEVISKMSKLGKASSLYSVGDTKAVTLNGTVGILMFNKYTTYIQILAFDHNIDVEMNGEHHMICGFGKSAITNGIDTCFVDSNYSVNSSRTQCFNINISPTNVGGWASSTMRSVICPAFKNALPNDLQVILRSRTIYTDNAGNNNNSSSSAVTTTTDTVYIPSEYEVRGGRRFANNYEQNYQKQLAYYRKGNSSVRYRYNSTNTTAKWWCRSAYYGDSGEFSNINTDGSSYIDNVCNSYGFVPLITI